MKIVDAFIPVFVYMEKLAPELIEDSSKSAAVVNEELKLLLKVVQELPQSHEQVQQAMFAVCAFIDEKLLESDWSERDEWSKKTLQQTYFDTNIAGQLFFQKLDSLNENIELEQQVREVYLYCLAQGFSGCYFNAGEQSFLQELIQNNYELLANSNENSLFQSSHNMQKVAPTEPNLPPQLKEQAFIWGPILLAVLSYVFFRNDLLDVISSALSQI